MNYPFDYFPFFVHMGKTLLHVCIINILLEKSFKLILANCCYLNKLNYLFVFCRLLIKSNFVKYN